MSDETYSFSTAKSRLEEIVTQVRKKDTSLEKSLDLLEEGVRLANACTELIDHADWTTGTETPAAEETAPIGKAAAEIVDGAPEGVEPEAEAVGDAGVESATSNGADSDVDTADVAETADAAAASDADFAPDDDAFGDAADESWADKTPDFADEESDAEPGAETGSEPGAGA